MAFDTDAGTGVSLRTGGTFTLWCCCAGGGGGVNAAAAAAATACVDFAGSGVYFSHLPFFDICWTKIISLSASENPGKVVAIAAFRLNPPVTRVLVIHGAKANLHSRAILLPLHHPEDVMYRVTSPWGLPVQTIYP